MRGVEISFFFLEEGNRSELVRSGQLRWKMKFLTSQVGVSPLNLLGNLMGNNS